jgi:hypothetical protein
MPRGPVQPACPQAPGLAVMRRQAGVLQRLENTVFVDSFEDANRCRILPGSSSCFRHGDLVLRGKDYHRHRHHLRACATSRPAASWREGELPKRPGAHHASRLIRSQPSSIASSISQVDSASIAPAKRRRSRPGIPSVAASTRPWTSCAARTCVSGRPPTRSRSRNGPGRTYRKYLEHLGAI